MRKLVIGVAFLLGACTTAQINQAISDANKVVGGDKPLTTAEVTEGLKEALIKGISNGSDLASQVDGYFKNDERNFLRAFYQLATQVEIDSNDRILLSKRLMETVGITDEVVITAFHDVIEIWDSKTYNETIIEPENFADMADEVWSKLNNNQ